MAIRCPKCGTSHDVIEFSTDKGAEPIRCRCGEVLDISMITTVEDFERYFESEDERENAREIQEDAQRVCRMILDDKYPEVDIEIAKDRLREKVGRLFPDKMETYQMIYEARFTRLWNQFREGGRASS